jgi:hypothetical protein
MNWRFGETYHLHLQGRISSDATASSSVAKVRGEVFAHSHANAVKRHRSMWNWLFGQPGRILYEKSPWCQRKLWACSCLCFSSVSPFSLRPASSIPFKHLCTAHAFFPERLSNHCQGLHRTFCEIFTNFDAPSFSDRSRIRIRPDTRLQIKGSKKSRHPLTCVKFCTLTPKIC